MNRLRRRKVSPDELRRSRQRKARIDAPTLHALLPAATQVCVELTFEVDTHLVHAPITSTIYPSAQAHFLYVCPFGNCDGTYDLDAEIFGMLRAGLCRATGAQRCGGHRARRSGSGPRCGLGVTYTVTVHYQPPPATAAARPAVAG